MYLEEDFSWHLLYYIRIHCRYQCSNHFDGRIRAQKMFETSAMKRIINPIPESDSNYQYLIQKDVLAVSI